MIHWDLNTKAILLDNDLIPKLSNFGWTRIVDWNMTSSIGTFEYMAPEVMEGKTDYN